MEQGERRMTKEELEKEAEEYANNLAFVFETDIVQRIVRERVRLALIDVLEPREKRIAELEKENAELKERADKADLDSVLFFNQLCKAKEIIREFVEWANWQGNSKCPSFKSIQNKAEQFLSEVEK